MVDLRCLRHLLTLLIPRVQAQTTAERERKNLHDERAGMKSKIEHLEANARSRERHVSQIAKLKQDLKDAQNQLENKSAENSRFQATLNSINEMSRKP